MIIPYTRVQLPTLSPGIPRRNILLGYSPCYYWDIPHETLNVIILTIYLI